MRTARATPAYDLEVDRPPAPQEAKDIVRRGYDRISTAYGDDVGDTKAGYPLWLQNAPFPEADLASESVGSGLW
jgi:hypothetical protein